VKHADGSKTMSRSTLADALGLDSGTQFVAFRDARAGLEFLRTADEIRNDGLWLQLDAYSCRVFGEFRELADPAGVWRRLAGELGGRGVLSLEDALRELELEPVYAALREVFVLAQDGRGGAIRRFVESVRGATGTTGDGAGVAAISTARLAAIDALGSYAPNARAPGGDGHRPGHQPATSDEEPLSAVRSAFTDRWHRAVLAGWAVLEPLGKLAPGAMTGPTSRAWFDELRLVPVVAGALREADPTLDEGAAWSAAERIRVLLALPRPSNVGGKSPAERAARLVDAWLQHRDVRPFIRVNTWEGVEWFGRQEWRELLDWTLLLDAVELEAERARSADARRNELTQTSKLILELAERGEEAGYRVDRLREVTVPAAAPPRRRSIRAGRRTGGA
jgi:hypothetical protein